ncbi:sugar phosphate isomerase/epimerase family protein [Thermodesulfobacteriota bacterium]
MNNKGEKRHQNIHLGGTARSPDDVRAIHAMGLDFAEIPIIDPEAFLEKVEDYKRLKKELGLYYLCHGPREGDPNDMQGLEGEYLPRILRVLPLMSRLKMSVLTIHLWLDRRFVNEDVITLKLGLLKRIIDRAGEYNIVVCLENLSEKATDLREAFQLIPALRLTLDLGHAQLLTENNRSYEFLEHFPEKIKHIHLHDNRGGSSYRDDLHLPPGEGIIDFAAIFEKILESRYKSTITLELRPPIIEACLGYVRGLLGLKGRAGIKNPEGHG